MSEAARLRASGNTQRRTWTAAISGSDADYAGEYAARSSAVRDSATAVY
jgi:hypothetical protein